MPRRSAAAAAVTLVLLAACAHAGAFSNIVGTPPDVRPVRVNVTNLSGAPTQVLAVGCSTAQRLGIVYPGLVGHYVLSQAMVQCGAAVEFVAVPSGTGRVVRAGLEQVRPGDVVDFQIATHLIGSYTSVRSGL